MESLAITPTPTTDPSKPIENATVYHRTDTGGRAQVRVVVTPSDAGDPADPKPDAAPAPAPDAKPADEPKPDAGTRPAWLPEKFATPQALKDAAVALAKKQGAPGYVIRGLEASESGQEVADAYKDFEKKIDPNAGKPKEEPKVEDKPKEEPKVEEPAPYVKPAEVRQFEVETYGTYVADMLDKVGVSAEAIGEEFTANQNTLTPATYEKFAKAGVAKPFLDAYISGMVGNANVLAEQGIAEVKASVGGPEEFGKLAIWGAANMTQEQHEMYTTMVNSRSVVTAKEAVKMLKGWYTEANGTPPVLVADTKPAATSGDGYASNEEMMADMKDPRYKAGDPAFHKKVEDKIRNARY